MARGRPPGRPARTNEEPDQGVRRGRGRPPTFGCGSAALWGSQSWLMQPADRRQKTIVCPTGAASVCARHPTTETARMRPQSATGRTAGACPFTGRDAEEVSRHGGVDKPGYRKRTGGQWSVAIRERARCRWSIAHIDGDRARRRVGTHTRLDPRPDTERQSLDGGRVGGDDFPHCLGRAVDDGQLSASQHNVARQVGHSFQSQGRRGL